MSIVHWPRGTLTHQLLHHLHQISSQEIIQKCYYQQLFSAFIPTLKDSEYTYMPWCFCEGIVLDTIVSYITLTRSSYDICVLSILQMINHRYDSITVTTSAMAADMYESMFAKHYLVIMPLISNWGMQRMKRENINSWRSRLWNVPASLVTTSFFSPWITLMVDYNHCWLGDQW